MIDEKRLLERLKERKKYHEDMWDSYRGRIYKSKKEAETRLDECTTILGLIKIMPKVGEWIPVSERLPNTNGVYSVTRKLVDGEHEFYISDSAYFDGQDTWHADNRVNHGREYLKDVIAWMPLQEPYKGD